MQSLNTTFVLLITTQRSRFAAIVATLAPFCFKHFYANFLTIVNKLTLFKIKKADPFETASL
jgi:hypothetical protein